MRRWSSASTAASSRRNSATIRGWFGPAAAMTTIRRTRVRRSSDVGEQRLEAVVRGAGLDAEHGADDDLERDRLRVRAQRERVARGRQSARARSVASTMISR